MDHPILVENWQMSSETRDHDYVGGHEWNRDNLCSYCRMSYKSFNFKNMPCPRIELERILGVDLAYYVATSKGDTNGVQA